MTRSPELAASHERHQRWIAEVRDPANAAMREPITFRAGRAYAEYELAPILRGGWASRYTCQLPESGASSPWRDYGSREEALTAAQEGILGFLSSDFDASPDRAAARRMVEADMAQEALL